EKKTNASSLVQTLKKTKEEEDAKLAAIDAQIVEFRKKNPTLNIEPIFQQQLAALSAEYTKAQLDTIEKRAAYQPRHPAVQKAQQKEEQLYNSYQAAFKQVMGLNIAAADYQKLVSDFTQKQEFTKQLERRINELDVTNRAEQIFNNVQVLEPARA